MVKPREPRKGTRHRKVPDALALQVGQRVRALRYEQAFSFDAFVEETGLGRGYISELERGLVVPSLHALARLASALEVTVADLVLGNTPREDLFRITRDWPSVEVLRLRKKALLVQQALQAAERKNGPHHQSQP
jgi:transcriptional regulator with XRE-family HTH domain